MGRKRATIVVKFLFCKLFEKNENKSKRGRCWQTNQLTTRVGCYNCQIYHQLNYVNQFPSKRLPVGIRTRGRMAGMESRDDGGPIIKNFDPTLLPISPLAC